VAAHARTGGIGMNGPQSPGLSDQWLTSRRFAGLLALFVFASFPEVLLGLESFVHRDFGLFGHPLAHYHRECFWRGELPLWNPLNNGGLPFLAQWNTLTLYPGSLIYLLFPLPWSLSVFCLAHLWWAGVGMFWLTQRWTKSRTAAGVAGVAFAFNGLTLNALMWPNNIAALAWMPWVVGCAEMGWRKSGRALAGAALAATLQMLTGAPEVILFTWLILATLCLSQWLQSRDQRSALAGRFCGLGILVFALSAAQLLPFLDLLRHSHRDASFATGAWAMPPWGWLNLIVPQFRVVRSESGLLYQPEQFWTSSIYPGAAVLALALWAAARWRQPGTFALSALLLVSLTLALGDAGKLYSWIRHAAPAANFMRYPIKFVVVAAFVLPLLAAMTVAEWEQNGRGETSSTMKRIRWLALALLGLCAGAVLWAKLHPLREGDFERTAWSAVRSGSFMLATLALVAAHTAGRSWFRGARGLVAVLVVLWLDVRTHVPNQNPTVPTDVLKPDTNETPEPAVELGKGRVLLSLAAMDEFYRKNLPDAAASYLLRRRGLHHNVNLLNGLPKVDGFFSLYLPEERRVHFRLYRSDHEAREGLADFLGVTHLTSPTNLLAWSMRPMPLLWVTGGQQPVFAETGTAMTNLLAGDFDPRRLVFLPAEARKFAAATNGSAVRVSNVEWSAQRVRVEIEAEGPSWLVFSQAHYHSWRALVDGVETPIWRANVAFQAVEIPKGRHEVKLVYRDEVFRLGCWMSLAGLAITALIGRRRAM